jgi:hypothetical protein
VAGTVKLYADGYLNVAIGSGHSPNFYARGKKGQEISFKKS